MTLKDLPSALAFPILHLNGSSGDVLLAGYMRAYEAVNAAHQILRDNAPHGRDYYVLGAEAYGLARKQHDARLDQLRRISEDLTEIALAVSDQLDKRKGAKAMREECQKPEITDVLVSGLEPDQRQQIPVIPDDKPHG